MTHDIPTLADALGCGAPPTLEGTRRVHRMGHDDEDEKPAAPPLQEAAMPKGHYQRKPRTNGAAAVTETPSTTTEAKPPKRKTPGPKKARAKKRTTPVVQVSNRRDGRATFVVNDLGAMSILAASKGLRR